MPNCVLPPNRQGLSPCVASRADERALARTASSVCSESGFRSRAQFSLEARPAAAFAAKYRLIHELGRGAMGAVWSAEDLVLRSPVAIKIIASRIARDPLALSRFQREALTLAAIRSPHVVQILEYGTDDGRPYIAMELLEGQSLAQRLSVRSRLPPLETARILSHVARALGRAHAAGIVHRDLTPSNVFILQNDDEDLAKLLDFGIAKVDPDCSVAPAAAVTSEGVLLGTPYYMSPDQLEGTSPVDFRTDIWSLGVIAFECLVGRRPFDGATFGALVLSICSRPLPVPSEQAAVPSGFDGWFAHACARKPRERFASAKEAAAALREVCDRAIGGCNIIRDEPRVAPRDETAAHQAACSAMCTTVPLFDEA